MPPGGLQAADFEHFRALATKWLQEAPGGLILSILALGRKMAPGGSRRPYFEHFNPWPPNCARSLLEIRFEHFRPLATHFRPVATKWLQVAPKGFILSIFGPWPPNGYIRSPEAQFQHFSGLGHQMAPGGSRRLILSIFGAWPPNGSISNKAKSSLQGACNPEHTFAPKWCSDEGLQFWGAEILIVSSSMRALPGNRMHVHGPTLNNALHINCVFKGSIRCLTIPKNADL